MEPQATDLKDPLIDLTEAFRKLLALYRGKGLKLWRVRSDLRDVVEPPQSLGSATELLDEKIRLAERLCSSLRKDLAEELRLTEDAERLLAKLKEVRQGER